MTEANMSVDDLLDGTIDDLADLPEFKPFSPGAHKCAMTMVMKEIQGFPAVEVTLTAKETMELADPTNLPVVAGDVASTAFFLKHSNPKAAELGQGKFKAILATLAPAYPGMSPRQIMEASKGVEVLAVTSTRDNKEKTKKYLDIVEIALV